ncbi:hypothetical protein ACM66B_006561 [Microbotryomycetes sp. NB124-2]
MTSHMRSPVLPTVLDPFTGSRLDASFAPPSIISLMPFSITYDGPSNLSQYFHPRPHTTPSKQGGGSGGHVEAWFRGRRVVCTDFKLPNQYKGLVYTTYQPVSSAVVVVKQQDRGVKKLRTMEGSAAALIKDPDETQSSSMSGGGTRKSPRKKAMAKARAAMAKIKKFSFDSDEEDDGAEQQQRETTKEENDADGDGQDMSGVEDSATKKEEQRLTAQRPALLPTTSTLSTASTATVVDTFTTTHDKTSDLVMQQQDDLDEQELAIEERHLVPSLMFESIQIWHADSEMNLQDDLYARCLSEWPLLAEKIHAY